MTYFADLSNYEYGMTDSTGPQAKNVGWLGPEASFETAEPDAELLDSLWQFCAVSVGQTRGLHDCHLCPLYTSNSAERGGKKLLLGSAEIRVFSVTGDVYASPNLIYHYVSAHRYRPPQGFVEALRTGPRPPGKQYFDCLDRHGIEWAATSVPDPSSRRFYFVRTPEGMKKVYDE